MNNKEFSRRNFLKQNALSGAGLVLIGGFGFGCGSGASEQTEGNSPFDAKDTNVTFENKRLLQLKERYRSDLFDKFLPNMDSLVIDHEFGGFMCSVDISTKQQVSSNKRAWYEGRGLWTYSFLYNTLDKNPAYLETARKSKNFILQQPPTNNDFWISSFDRKGLPTSGPGDIYSSLFVAEGLAEFSKASGEMEHLDQAKKIILSCLSRYDSSDYDYYVGYLSETAPKIPAPRVLGHWMVFLRAATQILESGPDAEMEELADRCVDAILNHHLHPEYNLLNEVLNHDLSRPDNEYKDFAYMGHGIETLWMLLFEAARRKDLALFDQTADLFKRHVTVAHDTVYGGYFRSLDHVDENKWKLDKVLWLQEEVLIGTLFIAEHTGDPWAQQCFEETLEYVHRKFNLPGYAFWTANGDRQLDEHNKERAEHYHHPRHLMLNLLAINRMIDRKGKISSLFA